MMAATNSYFQDDDESKLEQQQAQQQPAAASSDTYTGPRTLDGRPAPQASGSSSRARKPPVQKKRGVAGIATLSSLGGGAHAHDDDEDDDDDDEDFDDNDNRGNLFAGGEKSGLAVQDPKQEGGGSSKRLISDIVAKAKQYVPLSLSLSYPRCAVL